MPTTRSGLFGSPSLWSTRCWRSRAANSVRIGGAVLAVHQVPSSVEASSSIARTSSMLRASMP